MRAVLLLTFLSFLAACPPKPGQVVTCHGTWTCNDAAGTATELSSEDKTFCTDPDDPNRAGQINQFEQDFADTCDSVPRVCNDNSPAICAATCTPTEACVIDVAPQSVTL